MHLTAVSIVLVFDVLNRFFLRLVCGARRVESSMQGNTGEGARAWRVYRCCLAFSSQSRAARPDEVWKPIWLFGVVARKRVVDKFL